ncbi:glycoside hydrolase family 38 C-terminal domain-containing protein [Paenibacillus sp. GCM10027626]|uniref:glycoside hydrolase family 38 N-terminal domain-containing protein n=1 Tax=Paenibacillus sp. GCM10027626 TaxID=3273411 RepID=UPI00363AD18C
MNSIESRLRRLLGRAPQSYWDEKIAAKPGYWGERALAQLVFAQEMSKVNNGQYEPIIETALASLEARAAAEAVITEQAAHQVEQLLSPLAAEARSYTIHCAAHAHIDMNWMWSWDETVAVVLDTLCTMLNLMKEYPEFIYSQSQAAIYRIVEQFAPDMLHEIKQRIKEGRWEVTATHWVEADKNMPNGESMARHLLYAKNYLSQMLELDPNSLTIDFEPDTFGHSLHVPEILTAGGVRYYYHCRGHDEHILYRWQSPSGNSVIVYREPTWYNDSAQPMLASYIPDVCRRTGLKTYLNVYGVGDHGGGPTRRDLERFRDMQSWPVYPKIRFGTFADYFREAEEIRADLPVVTGELNGVFAGCYTSQSRIKLANRIGEAALNEAELFSAAAAAAADMRYPQVAYEEAWRNVLFNQFHDILPGSGVIATREHALGLFQQTLALANTNRKLALEQIAAMIDTSHLCKPALPDDKWTYSEGAGVGFGAERFKISQVERGFGNTRIVHIFNASAYEREEVAEIILWDWHCPNDAVSVRDSAGQAVVHQVLDQGFHTYWSHHYIRLLIWAKAPACGYSTYTVSEGAGSVKPFMPTDPRVDREEPFILENDLLRVALHPGEASIISLLHKPSGEQLIHPERPAGIFRLIQEDPAKGMTAWWVGRYMDMKHLHEGVKLKRAAWGDARQAFQYVMKFGRSALSVTVSLDCHSSKLDFHAECDWQEIGSEQQSIPQLNFHWPLAYQEEGYRYDVPFGTIVRSSSNMDVPGNSWIYGMRREKDKPAIMIVTDSKHGFRGCEQSLNVSLIRSSFDPDPYPELGDHHRFSMSVCVVDGGAAVSELIETAYRVNHPFNVLSGTLHTGTMPLAGSFMELVAGEAAISALKMPEAAAGKQWIVRAYDTEGRGSTVVVELFRPVKTAYAVDSLEQRLARENTVKVEGTRVAFPVPPFAVVAICIEFS